MEVKKMKYKRNWICSDCKKIVNKLDLQSKCECGCEYIEPTEWEEVKQ